MEKKQKIESKIEEPVSEKKEWPVDNIILTIAAIGVVLLLVVVWKGDLPFSGSFSGSDVAVTVNGIEISEEDVQAELAKIPAYYYSMMDNATIRSAILDQLIARELIMEKAESLGVSATQQEVEDALANVTAQAQMTQEEFLQRLEEENLTVDEVKALLEKQIIINKVIDAEVLKNVQITEEDILAYYENATADLVQVRASHILICYTDALRCEQNRTQEEAYAQAQDIIAQLKDSAEFTDLAVQSDDPSAEFNAGDLGWFSKGQMVKEFEDAVFSMNVGEITEEPVETEYGYHVIMVTDKKDSLEDFKESIAQQLTLEKQQTAVEDYLTALKSAAEIVYN
jgi:parvulin-like peptidyl-prolyl isomerase